MLKLLLPVLFAAAVAETVLIHPGDDELCIRADSTSEREQLSQGRCSTSGEDVRKWDIDEASPTLIRLHGTDVCLTGGVHRTWDGTLTFDPEDGDHAVLRACPEGHHWPAGYAWDRHEGEHGLSFKLDLGGDAWYLDASSGAAVFISKNEEPERGWTLEPTSEEEADLGKKRIAIWDVVGEVLAYVVEPERIGVL